jgi:hypothetical protein
LKLLMRAEPRLTREPRAFYSDKTFPEIYFTGGMFFSANLSRTPAAAGNKKVRRDGAPKNSVEIVPAGSVEFF